MITFDEYVYLESDRRAKLLIAEQGFPTFLNAFGIWGKPIRPIRQGDTAVGHTLEWLLGIKENNKRHADLYGYEVKGTASDQSQITLFTSNPTAPERAVHSLVQHYGKPGIDGYRFNTNLIVNRRTSFSNTFLTLEYDGGELRVLSGDQGIVAYWSMNDMLNLTQKIQNMMLSVADRLSDLEGIHFIFNQYTLYNGFSFAAFEDCIRNGQLSIHFRIEGTQERAINKGVGFRMRRQDIALLYEYSATFYPTKEFFR